MASSSGLAVAAVGYVDIKESSFDGKMFVCGEGEFLHASKVCNPCACFAVHPGSRLNRYSIDG